jgi:mono/diheme cytochrome c family protein
LTFHRARFTSALILGVALLFVAAGCRSKSTVPVRPLTPVEQQGAQIFQANCAVCHAPRDTTGPHGPGLQGLFKKKYLPSGAPANDDRVRATILHGRNMMPPFAYTLDDAQINALLAYLHTL